jgi:hypothetical protein
VRILASTHSWGIAAGRWTASPRLRRLDPNDPLLSWRLRDLAGDSVAMQKVRLFLTASGISPRLLTDDEVFRQVRALAHQGRVTVFLRTPTPGATATPEATEPVPPPPSAPPADRPATDLSWIEIELVDDQENPVGGIRYRAVLPDGSVRQGSLDSRGRARLEEINPGECEISFPEVDGREWEPV